jgi:hypothetical protein
MKYLYLILVICYQASAQMTIVVPEVDNFSKIDSPGFLNDLLSHIQESLHTDINYSVSIMPVKRALDKYLSQESICLLGADEQLTKLYVPGFKQDDFIFSKPYLTIRSKIFSLNNEVCDINMLKGKNVATTLEFPVAKFININELKNFHNLHSFQSAMKMLLAQRVDYYVGFLPANYTFNTKIKYCTKSDLTKHNDTLQCHNTTENKKFIKLFNQTLDRLKESGKLQKLYKKYFPGDLDNFYKEVL